VVGLTRRLRDFCVTQWCFVVLSGEFATDIPRAWLLRINYLRLSKSPAFLSLRASNQVVGGSNPSGRANFSGIEDQSSARVVDCVPFELPASWFVVEHAESRIIQQRQLIEAIELCYTMPTSPLVSR